MTKFFIIFLFLPLSINVLAHDFYFSFAELQYNQKEQKIEVSISVTGHDFEKYLTEKEVGLPQLEDCKGQPMDMIILEDEINNGFQLSQGDDKIQLHLLGMNVKDDGEVVFFLSSSTLEKPKEIEVRFDLLMNFYIKQQNKLTLFKPNGKEYFSFLSTRPKRTIKL